MSNDKQKAQAARRAGVLARVMDSLSIFTTWLVKARREKSEKRKSRAAENAKALIDGGTIRVWRWDRLKTQAHTKSEARAAFKKRLALKRLPIGANVVAV